MTDMQHVKEENKALLLKFARERLEGFENNLSELADLVKQENRNLQNPLTEADVYKIMRKAVTQGAIRKSIICNSASNIDFENTCEPVFFIPQILSDGVTFCNSPPKGGKSRLFLQMALALCNGKMFMGRQCKRVSCLYLALEDEREDFESRLRLFLKDEKPPKNLFYATLEDFNYEPPTLEDNAIIDLIENNLRTHKDIRVVLIDVFGAIRSKRQRGEDFTDTERRDIQSLLKLAARNKVAVVVAHHVSHTKRKGQLETIGSGAGSYVIAATVHAEMLLYKNKENNNTTFSVQGRRIPFQKFAVEDDFPKWRFCGGADEYAAINNPLITTIKHILDDNEIEKWCGLGSEIVKYAAEHDLPTIHERINKHTFSPTIIKQLGIMGISYQQIKNGKGAVKHQFSKL